MDIIKIKKYSVLILAALIVSITIVFGVKKNSSTKTVSSNTIEKLTKNDESIKSGDEIFVDVKGSVKAPGVYKLDTSKIIMDAVNSAGGFEDWADTTYINLSKKLTDEMVIYIFSHDEVQKLMDSGEITEEKSSTIGGVINNDAYIASDKTDNTKNNNDITEKSSEKKDTKNSIININTASKEELMNLSGIGESKAKKIINYRIDNGNFQTIEDIKNVSGIGDSIYEKIKDSICV